MAAVPGFLSGEQFERLYADGRKPSFEYWFGEDIQKPAPPSMHGALQGIIFMLLFQQGWRTAVETRIKLSKAAFPVPDVIASASVLPDSYPTEAFDLCANKEGRTVTIRSAEFFADADRALGKHEVR